MLKKKDRTVEQYLRAGAYTCVFRALTTGHGFMPNLSAVLSHADTEKLIRLVRDIRTIFLKAETNMFKDHPQLTNKYLDVFANDGGEQRNEVGEEIVRMADEIARGLFQEE